MSRNREKTSTEKTSAADPSAQSTNLSDATVGFRAMVSCLERAGVTVHIGYDSGAKEPTLRDKAGNFAITIAGAHIEQLSDGPVIVADKKAEPSNEKTPV